MKLYHFPSPNPQKVTFALLELGLDCEQIPVDLAKGDHQEPAFLEVNRAGAAMKSPHLLDLSGIGNPGVLPSRPDSGA